MAAFRTILIIIFIAAFIVAVLVFANVIKVGDQKTSTVSGAVTIWGPFPRQSVQTFIDELNIENTDLRIKYEQKSPQALDTDLIEAIASGTQPDLVIFSDKTFLRYRDKLTVAPYTSYPERLYRDTYVDGASVFLTTDGVQLFPLLVDPLVVYYNKDILAKARYITPPTTWEGLNASIPLLLRKDVRGAIVQSPIALGETLNINHFKDIVAAMLLQTGSPIVTFDKDTNTYVAAVEGSVNGSVSQELSPQAQAVSYYTSFSNATNALYSWNKSQTGSLDTFLSGKSGFYIGRASELFTIQSRNPNLNFDVTQLFQPSDPTRPISYGEFYGIGVLKSSKNFSAAYSTALQFADKPFVDYLSKQLSLPPVRRDLLLAATPNAYLSVFFNAAANAFAWPDPNDNGTDTVFGDMIRKVNSGELTSGDAIYEASKTLQSFIR